VKISEDKTADVTDQVHPGKMHRVRNGGRLIVGVPCEGEMRTEQRCGGVIITLVPRLSVVKEMAPGAVGSPVPRIGSVISAHKEHGREERRFSGDLAPITGCRRGGSVGQSRTCELSWSLPLYLKRITTGRTGDFLLQERSPVRSPLADQRNEAHMFGRRKSHFISGDQEK
jgi:hypothetical protein